MNFLAHLYIAEATATSYAGALLGDYVRGPLDGTYNQWIETGIRLHRRVDSFTDSHPIVRRAFRRLTPPFRRYAGILVDVYFDHLLARQWAALHASRLDQFTRAAGHTTRAEWPADAPFPAERLRGLPELLQSYREPAGIAEALERIDQRLSRPSPLPRAWPQLQQHDPGLSEDFDAFFPDLLAFARAECDNFAITGKHASGAAG